MLLASEAWVGVSRRLRTALSTGLARPRRATRTPERDGTNKKTKRKKRKSRKKERERGREREGLKEENKNTKLSPGVVEGVRGEANFNTRGENRRINMSNQAGGHYRYNAKADVRSGVRGQR